MRLDELVPAILSGEYVRCEHWVDGVAVKWDWQKGWMVTGDHGHSWQKSDFLPHPADLRKDDWAPVDFITLGRPRPIATDGDPEG